MDSRNRPYDVYSGAAMLQLPKIGIAALGSYARLNGSPSLFIYGVLDAALGGFPFFFIEGLAAGFGYNRGFIAAPALTALPISRW